MQCLECNHKNPDGSRFCNTCGAELELMCSACAHLNPPSSRFCNACGHHLVAADASGTQPTPSQPDPEPLAYTPRHLAEKILTSRSALEGERKQVTVMFADVAGFTNLARQLDPEVVHDFINHCFALITEEVHRFEGTINQYTGDGVMALFGAPIAHEDSPLRAVHAALGIQRALQDFGVELEDQRGFSFQMRIGINTGLVVVGRIGDDLRMDYTAVGDTTNLAARLQQLAEPGTVVLSASTHRLVEGFFETGELGEHLVKGHPEPIAVFEALRARTRRTRLDVTADQGLTPLTGRETELQAMLNRFQQVISGQGQVVLLVGEAGVGKSRHLLEFRHALQNSEETAVWLEGRCLSFGQNSPFLPLVDQLRTHFDIGEGDGEAEIVAKVEDGMRGISKLVPHISAVRYVFAVDTGDNELTALEPAVRRKQLVQAALEVLLQAAKDHPLILVYEDLHWIDTSTEEFLGALLDAVEGAPILLILTYRPGYAAPFASRSFSTTLSLQRLSDSDTLSMASRILNMPTLPEQLQALLLEKTEGVPLFVEEVVKALFDVGMLHTQNGTVVMRDDASEIRVPDTIQGIIMARLDHLGDVGKRTVQLASVIGRQFLVRLLERVSEWAGPLDGLLAELQALELIYRQGLLPEPAYVFKHAVIQDVAYNSLLIRQRGHLHRAVGEAIEELYAERLTDHIGELAHHFMQGEEWTKALKYSRLAGDRAADAFASHEARAHYEHALHAASHMTPPPNSTVVARLHAKHANILSTLGDYEAAVVSYEQALDLIRSTGDRYAEAEFLVGLSFAYHWAHQGEPAIAANEQALALARELNDTSLKVSCIGRRVHLLSSGYGRLVETAPDVEEGLRLIEVVNSPKVRAEGLIQLGTALQWRGGYDRGMAALRSGIERAQAAYAGMAYGLGTFFLGHACVSRGAYEEALHWYRCFNDYASVSGSKLCRARVPNSIGGVHLELFDIDEALRLNLEGVEVAKANDAWPDPQGHSLVKVALAYLYKGEYAQAEVALSRAAAILEDYVWMQWRWQFVLYRALGELALAQGQHEEAWIHATESLRLAMQSDSRKHIVRAQHLQGEILAATDQLDDAVQTFTRVIRQADQLGTPREVWLGKAALGKVLMRLHRDEAAETLLTEATQELEAIADALRTPQLRKSLLSSTPAIQLYHMLGRRPPQ